MLALKYSYEPFVSLVDVYQCEVWNGSNYA